MTKGLLKFIVIYLTLCLFLAGCSAQENSEDASGSTQESAQTVTIDHRYASKEEGAQLLLDNEEYYAGFSRNDLDFRSQSLTGTMDEYKAFAKEQVLDFTDKQKEYLDMHLDAIASRMAEKGYTLPEMDQIVFISTTMKEECDVLAYTHGTQIYIDGAAIESYMGNSEKDKW